MTKLRQMVPSLLKLRLAVPRLIFGEHILEILAEGRDFIHDYD